MGEICEQVKATLKITASGIMIATINKEYSPDHYAWVEALVWVERSVAVSMMWAPMWVERLVALWATLRALLWATSMGSKHKESIQQG